LQLWEHEREAANTCGIQRSIENGREMNAEDGGNMFLQKRWLISTGLHGIISQKIELFIVTTVTTLNPTVWFKI
jgi:hypothetical protein